MSMIDQAFSESVLRLQSWLQFLERKGNEYQAQMSRVRRSAAVAEPVAAEPAPVVAPTQSAEEEAGWE